MKLEDVINAWNAQADEHNQWKALDADERVEFTISLFDKAPRLTETQQYVVSTLIAHGAHFFARTAETAWLKGDTVHLDSRNGAGKGLARKIAKANEEALANEAK